MAIWRVIYWILQIYTVIIFVRLILSWFPRPPESLRPLFGFLFVITEPVLRLARPLIPPLRTGGMALDLSPILVFVLLAIATGIAHKYAYPVGLALP